MRERELVEDIRRQREREREREEIWVRDRES